jgi:hypothetical protein
VVGRLTLSNSCISGSKEVRARMVGLVRSGSVRSMFDAMFNRCSMRCSINIRCDVQSMFDAMFDRPFSK